MAEDKEVVDKGTEKAPEAKVEETSEVVQSSIDKLDRAELIAKRIEEATVGYKAENDRREKMEIDNKLGGESLAGQPPPEKKEETPKEYAERIMRGEEDGKKE